MKNQVKRFGQFVNEGREGMSKGEMVQEISTLGMFVPGGMGVAGSIEFVNSDEDFIIVDFPKEQAEDWEAGDWQSYVCSVAMENGIDAVYFPEDGVVVKCDSVGSDMHGGWDEGDDYGRGY